MESKMNKIKPFLLIMVLAVLVVGCSKEKKDEAAKLQKELMGDSTQVMDSLAEVQRVTDSIATEQAEVDKDRKSTRLNSSHTDISRMPSSA